MEQYIMDISEVEPCRVCSSLEGSLNIFTDQLEDDDVTLHEALEFVTCLKVDTDDGMSLSLCLSCSGRLLDAYRFKNQALDSCKHFNKLSTNIISVKEVELEEVRSETVTQLDQSPEQTSHNITEEEEENAGDEIAHGEKKPEVDMSTDAVAFLIEQYVLKNNKKVQPPPESTDNDWVSESIRQNPRSKYGKYECQVCDRKFRKKSNLVDHLRLHANVKKFVCSYCDKSFVQIANYQMHLRIHTKERPFQCPLCEKSYNQSSTLKIHIRSHTQERNYVCPECDKKFTNSSDLAKHRKVHDPSQQYKCEYCGKFFAQKVNMKTHQRKYHSDVNGCTLSNCSGNDVNK